MRLPLLALALAVFAIPLRADPVSVTVIDKDGRHGGVLSVSQIEVQTNGRVVKVPLAEVGSIQFGDTDVVRTRPGQRIKGTIRAEGWTLKEGDTDRPLSRADLRFVVPQI